MSSSEMLKAIKLEWGRRKHVKLCELAPRTIELLEDLVAQEPSHLQERAMFLLQGYREYEDLRQRELK